MARIATIVRHGRIGLRAALCAVAVLAGALVAPAEALNFPALTGRVVDEAGILDASVRSEFIDKLAALETKTTDQLVVATVRSLENTSVEDYANRLFREWKLGQKDKNNGVLLLVAPNERKVRIEVGYGLEGTLTDARSRLIIESFILPRFRERDFAGGISRGPEEIIAILTRPADGAGRPRPAAGPWHDNGGSAAAPSNSGGGTALFDSSRGGLFGVLQYPLAWLIYILMVLPAIFAVGVVLLIL